MSKNTTSGNTGFTDFFSRLFCLFTIDTCEIHCFNLTGRKMKKAAISRAAKENHYPAVFCTYKEFCENKWYFQMK